jgi:hypothetical protein
MPVTKMTDVSPLSEPTATTAPLLKGIYGRKGTTQPLTPRSYEILAARLMKAQQSARFDPGKDSKPKLGFLMDRAKIPRAIGLKMADLTESYSEQMWGLLDAALAIDKDEDEPFGPELEGVFEKSRVTAKRFQQAMDAVERCYAALREESSRVVIDAARSILAMNTDESTKLQLLDALFLRYDVDYQRLVDGNDVREMVTPKTTLLPLLKGKNVYRNKSNTLGYLTSSSTKVNQSSELAWQGRTKKGTVIEMLYQVQPKFETSVFSDHAGFVSRFSCNGCPPLFVYYHSLEHGQQHTDTRTAWNFGSHSSLNLALQGSGKVDPEESAKLSIHDHRQAYVKSLYEELRVLLPHASSLKHGRSDSTAHVVDLS